MRILMVIVTIFQVLRMQVRQSMINDHADCDNNCDNNYENYDNDDNCYNF